MDQERRGLRFPFEASARVAPESSPSASITVSVKELSLHGPLVPRVIAAALPGSNAGG